MQRRSDRGGFGLWALIVLILALLFGGYRVGQLYFDHASLTNEVKLAAQEALTNPAAGPVQEKVVSILRNHDATFDPEAVSVTFNEKGDRMTIDLSYSRAVDLVVMKLPRVFSLNLQAEAPRQAGVIQGVQESLEDAGGEAAKRWEDAARQSGQ